ncbi:MAG: DUF86 domain-containing protein [Lautropia sp.]|nr:DUF86 domain-containing protein [Lautropia sp.]
MKRDQLILADYLEHIQEAITSIVSYVEDVDEVGFLNNRMMKDAVIRNFEIIGEASNNIRKHYPEFVESNPDLPFLTAYQMRNALAHGYFKVDYEIVWKAISRDLPPLYIKIQQVLDGLRPSMTD